MDYVRGGTLADWLGKLHPDEAVRLAAEAAGITVTTGTPAYMAPEQADSTGGLDGRADVYSLSVVTWELLTGTWSRRPRPLTLLRQLTGQRLW